MALFLKLGRCRMRMFKKGNQRGRRVEETAGVPSGVRRGLVRPENEVGTLFQHPSPGDEAFDVVPQCKHHNADKQEQADLLSNFTLPFA